MSSYYPETDWNPQWDDDEDDEEYGQVADIPQQNPSVEPESPINNLCDSNITNGIIPREGNESHYQTPKVSAQGFQKNNMSQTTTTNGVTSTGGGNNESEFFKRKFYNKNELFSKWKGKEQVEEGVTEQECAQCGMRYKDLKIHLQVCPRSRNKLEEGNTNGDQGSLKCSECGKMFSKRIHLTLHMKIHAKMGKQQVQPAEKKFGCKFCHLHFDTNNELTAHFRLSHYNNYIHSQLGAKLDEENPTTNEDHDLNTWSHCATQVLKEGVDHLSCDKCEKTFSNEKFLKQHQVVHERAPLSCLFCGATFPSNGLLMTHMLIHDEADSDTRFGCTRCGRRFGRQNQLNFHVKFCKVKVQDEDYSVSNSKAGKRQNYLSNETVTTTNTEEEQFDGESLEEKKQEELPQKFGCLDCGREFNRINYLNFHMKIHMKFCNSCNLQIHEKEYVEHEKSCSLAHITDASIDLPTPSSTQSVPEEKKNLPCEICSKIFSSDLKLSQHCLTHAFSFEVDVDSPEFQSMLPLRCEYEDCERRFSDNADLTNHIQQKHKSTLPSHRCSSAAIMKNQISNDKPKITTNNFTSTSKPTFYYMKNGSPPSPNPYILIPTSFKENADEVLRKLSTCAVRKLTGIENEAPVLLEEKNERPSDPNFQNRTGRRGLVRLDIPIQSIYTCKICNRRFPKHKRQKYITHLSIHEKEDKFGCHLCDRKFLSENLLNEHVQRHSDPNYRMRSQRQNIPIQDLYICGICNQRFSKQKRQKYIHHLWVHRRESQFGCHLCDRKFWTEVLLTEHVKRHSDPNYTSSVGRRYRHDIPIQDIYICKICNQRFPKDKRQKYITHLWVHEKEDKFGCHLCDRKFLSENLLNEHVQRHSDPNYRMRSQRQNIPIQDVYICEICDRRFPQQHRQKYIHHLWVHRKQSQFGCHLCDRKFWSQVTLNEHVIRHSDPNYKSRVRRRFQSTLNINLRKHMDGTFRARPGRPGRKDIPFQDVYTCLKCGNEFSERRKYIIHLHYHNQKLKSSRYKCQYCYKSFSNQHLLAEHVEKHADPNFSNRPGRGGRQDIPIQDVYFCEECADGQPYHDRQKYILHLRSHNLGRKFECPHCSRSFTNEGNLRYHVEIHKSVKNFQCKDCLKMFSTRQARHSHQQKFCKKVPCKYRCSRCSDRFHSKLILTRHFEKEHSEQERQQESQPDIELPCPNCSQTFNTTFGLTRHIQIYHPTTNVTFTSEVYNAENPVVNEPATHDGETVFNAETFGNDENSTHSNWNTSDHHGGGDDDDDDYINVTDMLATNFCETELTVEEPAKQPDGKKDSSKTSRYMCQCGVLKKYKSQIFCHNRQCPCVQKGRKCGEKCRCKASCLNTDDIEHVQQQTFKESKEKMLLEQQLEQTEASVSPPHDENSVIVPPPVLHIQQTSFSNEVNAATSLSYGALVPSEYISLDAETDASIQRLSLSGYVEGEEDGDDGDPLSDPLQSTSKPSVAAAKTVNPVRTSFVNNTQRNVTSKSSSSSTESSILISALNSQQSQLLSCQFCGTNKKNFKLVSAYISHMFGHAKEVGFNCPICKKSPSFVDVISLVRHVDSHNKGVNLQCKKCSSSFKSYTDLDKHLRVHHYKPMECGVCGIKFPDSHEMVSHWSQKHPTCQCGVCNLKFFSYEDLTQHMKDLHSPVDCIQCVMRFEKLEELITHFIAKHRQPSSRPVSGSSSSLNHTQAGQMSLCDALMTFMNCGYCNQKFTNSDDLNEHLYTHVPPDSATTSRFEDTDFYKTYTNLSCNECGATYNNINDLSDHLTSHLQRTTPSQQPSSSRVSTDSQLYQVEVDDNNIEAVEAFTCSICHKTFNTKSGYALHIRSHNITICSACYSTFDSIQDLRKHYQTSSCVVFECDICTRTFSAPRYLTQHQNKVHKHKASGLDETGGGTNLQPIIVASTSLAPPTYMTNPQHQFRNSRHQQHDVEEIVLE